MKRAWLLLVAATAYAQTTVPAYNLLRDREDWSVLRDPAVRGDYWDPVKYIELGPEGWYVSVGGEVREVFRQLKNDTWGKQPDTNTFVLQRYMLHSDWRLGEHFRAFVQLKSAVEMYRRDGPRPVDEKRLDLEAAFVEVSSGGKTPVVLRVGRQELNYGSGRLISVREGPNTRQSFDGVRLYGRWRKWDVNVFAVRPDLDKAGFFDNAPDHRTSFWGVYASRARSGRTSVDVYYAGLDRKRAVYDRGAGREIRHSVAARLWRPARGKEGGWDFDYESVWQFGSFAGGAIRAWTAASDNGYSAPALPMKPRFSVKADISSGDDRRTGTLKTFNALFPIGNYFGVMADTGPGPQNFMDLHPRVQLQPARKVSVSLDMVAQWRENVRDGVYSVPGILLVASYGSRARFVGYRPGVEARWQIDRHAYLQADYGVYYAGRFLREAAPGRNINYFALMAGYKF